MDENEVRRIISQELHKSQYRVPQTSMHTHNGIDSPPVFSIIGVPIINVATSTNPTLSASQSGSIVVMNATTGSLIKLPVVNTGLTYEFIVATAATSGSHGIITNSTGATFIGGITESTLATGTVATFFGSSTLSGIHMNGTTTGGSPGTYIRVTGINATQWLVNGYSLGSGVLSTPFFTL